MRQAKFLDQTRQALRLFQRVQVFALNVFDQRHGGGGFIGHIAHQHRHFCQPGQTRGTEAPLARDDFVLAGVLALGQLAHQNWLHDALSLDALGQLIQRTFVHARAWLVLACHHHIQRQRAGHTALHAGHGLFFFADFGAQQGFQTASQALGFLSHHC